nr:MAG TPA: hypothetical protein [Caudoviricetes sp.]
MLLITISGELYLEIMNFLLNGILMRMLKVILQTIQIK